MRLDRPRRAPRPVLLGLTLALGLLATGPARGQGQDYVRANYTKYEHRVSMRDGVTLFTSVYVPKAATADNPAPIVLCRTPYSVAPYGVDKFRDNLGPSPLFGKAGYIVAYQDVRGRYMSGGTFVDVRPQIPDKKGPQAIDESSDTFDTIDWLVKNVPGNNGKVGTWGISYPGFYAAASAIDSHPAHKAASPQAPLVDWWIGDDVHHNGAFFLHQSFNFDAVFGLPRPEPTTKGNPKFDHGTPDSYDFFLKIGPLAELDKRFLKGKAAFWLDEMAHPNYDEFWKARALWPHLKDVRPALLTVGGWFDAEDLYGPLQVHKTVEANHPKSDNILVMGPWVHGGWSRGDGDGLGTARFDAKTAEFYRESIEFPFFEHHLRGSGSAPWTPPKAWTFETGRNVWHKHAAWPPTEAKPMTVYLKAGNTLGLEPETAEKGEKGDAGYVDFPSDPAHPVPYTTVISPDYPATFMVEDQRFASRRPDVLTYESEPLKDDLRVVGPIKVELHVSTTGTDADWVVKLIDVLPDDAADPDPNPTGVRLGGAQRLIRAEVIRGRFRDSREHPTPFKPGEIAVVPLILQDIDHCFRPGHKLMVQVQSSWFPLVDRNPQTFVDIATAKPSDFVKATHRVYHAPGHASKLEILTLP